MTIRHESDQALERTLHHALRHTPEKRIRVCSATFTRRDQSLTYVSRCVK